MEKLLLTSQGEELLARVIAGETKVQFTKIQTSSFIYTSLQIPSLTSLQQVKQEVEVSSVEIRDNDNVVVNAMVDNSLVDTAYSINSIGLFAQDDESVEILYGVSIAGGFPEYVPDKTSPVGLIINFTIDSVDSNDVTIVIDPTTSVNIGQFNTFKNTPITNNNGVHGLKLVDGKFQVYENDTWSDAPVETLSEQNKLDALNIKILGYTVPDDMSVQNYVEDGVFHQKVDRRILSDGSYEYFELDAERTFPVDGQEAGYKANKGTIVNLINSTLETTTLNGVTCTNNGDGTYTLNGTASALTLFNVYNESNLSWNNKKLRIAGCPQGGSPNTYALRLSDRTVYYGADYGDGGEYTLEGDGITVQIAIRTGVTVNNLLFKPLITTNLLATYDDFVPYTGDTGSLNGDVAQVRGAIGDAWNGTDTYAVGDLRIDENGLYKCLIQNSGQKPSTSPTYWEKTSVEEELKEQHYTIAGTEIDITGYTYQQKYVFPYDGYVRASNGGTRASHIQAVVLSSNDIYVGGIYIPSNMVPEGGTVAHAMFVRKNMKCYMQQQGGSAFAKYIPLIG